MIESERVFLTSANRDIDDIPVMCRYDELKPVSDLIVNPNNVKHHPEEQLVRIGGAIQENGWRQPVVVSNRSGFIVKGEGRFRTAILLSLRSVPVEYQEYETEEDELADLIADNMAGEGVTYDVDRIRRLHKRLETEKRRRALALDKRTHIRVNSINNDESGGLSNQADNTRKRQRSVDQKREKSERSIPEMETLPYEHHDYIMFSFENSRDFVTACTKLGVGKVQFTLPETVTNSAVQKVGVGRVMSGDKLIDLLEGVIDGNQESDTE